MYFIDNEKQQLRVCETYLSQNRNKSALENSRLIILQHILTDTMNLLLLLKKTGAEIHSVIAKQYSIDENVIKTLENNGFNVVKNTYKELEETNILMDILKDAIEKSKTDNKKIVIIEVGGYFAKPLSQLSEEDSRYISGVVEDTTFGHNRYSKLLTEIKVPIASVARSPLKEIEARFVGDSVVNAMDIILREIGVSISGRNALVIGYGMIGRNVARALRARNLFVSVYDKEDYKNIDAFCEGFKIHKKAKLLESADIIFSATGNNALSIDDIENCKHRVVLVSAGSKDIEFDVEGIAERSFGNDVVITENITRYKISVGNEIYLVRNGTAVNFLIKSVPDEVIDLVFAELLLAAIRIIKEPEQFALHKINATPDINLSAIAKDWLKHANF